MKTESRNEELNLLGNGLEFIKTAFSSFNQIVLTEFEQYPDSQNLWDGYEKRVVDYSKLKYSILHLSSGVELILKEKLRREDWKLLFRNIDNAKLSSFYSGDFNSIYFDVIKKRLESKRIILDPIFIADYTVFRKERNRIEHFHFKPDREGVKLLMGRLASDIIDFIAHNLSPHLFGTKEIELYSDFISELINSDLLIGDFRMEKVKKKIEQDFSGKQVIRCCYCFNETLVLDETNNCLYCGMKPTNVVVCERLGRGDGIPGGFENCSFCSSKFLFGRDNEQICLDCRKVVFVQEDTMLKK